MKEKSMALNDTLKTYYKLTKPGIIYGNSITAAAGFMLASNGHINFKLLVSMLAGISLVMASGCVYNNVIDRDIDKKMKRTKNRALVTGEVTAQNALMFASVLGIAGITFLITQTNKLTAVVALIGLLTYVVLYGIGKRRSVHGTVIGSISGAVPPVVGYCAVTNRFDLGALLLFLILVCWQMPHFYAIATYRIKDYANAGLPILTVKKGVEAAKKQMIVYILAFIAATIILHATGYTGYTYLVVVSFAGFAWLRLALQGLKTDNNERWARKLFGFSLIVLLTFSVMISLDSFLP
ncbi:MAG: heme o synthase [Patescibacteria group bacterium]